jgi:hypothetical protein
MKNLQGRLFDMIASNPRITPRHPDLRHGFNPAERYDGGTEKGKAGEMTLQIKATYRSIPSLSTKAQARRLDRLFRLDLTLAR